MPERDGRTTTRHEHVQRTPRRDLFSNPATWGVDSRDRNPARRTPKKTEPPAKAVRISGPPRGGSTPARGGGRSATRTARAHASAEQALSSDEAAILRGSRKVQPKPQRRKSLAHRASKRIMRKHKVLGSAVYVGVGALIGLGKGAKHASTGVALGSAWTARHARSHVQQRMATRKWAPHGQAARPIAGAKTGRRRMLRTNLVCACGKGFSSIEDMNHHFLTTHAHEPRAVKAKTQATIRLGATRRTAGKLIVRPTGMEATGRHRRKRTGPLARTQKLVQHYQAEIRQIGEKTMTAGGAAKRIVVAFNAWRESLPAEGKATMYDLQEQAAGLEAAMLAAAETISQWGIDMIKMGVDPDLVRPHVRRMSETAESLGAGATAFLANFMDVYAVHIRAARGGLSAPDPSFWSKQAG